MKAIKSKVDRPDGQRIKGEVNVCILSLNEIRFSTRTERESESAILTVNGVEYDGLVHNTKKYPAGQRYRYPWGDEAGWFGHDKAGTMFSYPRELTNKARKMLEPFFRELSEKIQARNPELFLQAEIERCQGMIERSKEEIDELQENINKEQSDIDGTVNKIKTLEIELEKITTRSLRRKHA